MIWWGDSIFLRVVWWVWIHKSIGLITHWSYHPLVLSPFGLPTLRAHHSPGWILFLLVMAQLLETPVTNHPAAFFYAWRMCDHARLPTRRRASDAGFDVSVAFPQDLSYWVNAQRNSTQYGMDEKCGISLLDVHTRAIVLPPGHRVLLPTGVRVTCPAEYAYQIWARSGSALRDGLQVMAGLVDSSYEGEVQVLVHNASRHGVLISEGDRVAQLVPVRLGLIPALTLGQEERIIGMDPMPDTAHANGNLSSAPNVASNTTVPPRGWRGFGSSGLNTNP